MNSGAFVVCLSSTFTCTRCRVAGNPEQAARVRVFVGAGGQDRVLDQLGRKWKKDYYLPTSMDAAVGALRKWFSDLAPPLPWDAAGPQAPLPEVSRHDLLERFHSHTEKCPSCMQVPSPFPCSSTPCPSRTCFSKVSECQL